MRLEKKIIFLKRLYILEANIEHKKLKVEKVFIPVDITIREKESAKTLTFTRYFWRRAEQRRAGLFGGWDFFESKRSDEGGGLSKRRQRQLLRHDQVYSIRSRGHVSLSPFPVWFPRKFTRKLSIFLFFIFHFNLCFSPSYS